MKPRRSTDRPRVGVDGRVLDDPYHGIGRMTYDVVDRLTVDQGFDITLLMRLRQRLCRLHIARISGRPGVRIARFDHELTSGTQFLRWPATLRRARVDITLFPYHLGASLFGGGHRFAV